MAVDESMKERCVRAAIKMPDGTIIEGLRHSDCYGTIRSDELAMESIHEVQQGFVTSTGRFVGREEAMIIQRESGIPSAYSRDGEYRGTLLFSEDLY